MRAGEVYVNPASGERAVVLLGLEDGDRDRLVVDLHLKPGGGMVGRHYHPSLRERFTVREGRMRNSLNGQEHTAEVGDAVEIESGVLHDFWNPDANDALVRVDVQPARRFVQMIKNGFGLAQDGKTDAEGKPTLLQIALFARSFDDVIRYDKGPRWAQQVLFLLLTPFARIKGLKGSYPEYLTRPPSDMVPLAELDRSGL